MVSSISSMTKALGYGASILLLLLGYFWLDRVGEPHKWVPIVYFASGIFAILVLIENKAIRQLLSLASVASLVPTVMMVFWDMRSVGHLGNFGLSELVFFAVLLLPSILLLVIARKA